MCDKALTLAKGLSINTLGDSSRSHYGCYALIQRRSMALWKDNGRGGKWRYEFQYQGVRYSGSQFPTKGVAWKEREDRKERLRSAPSLADLTPGVRGFRDAANSYLDQAQVRFPPKTYKHKRYAFGLFLAHHGEDIPIVDVSIEHVMSYLNTRPSVNNFTVHRKEMSSLFTYCIRTLKVITSNPCWGIDKMPYTPARKKIPTQEEFLKLVAAADEEESDFILTIFHSLARLGEILRLRWEDVNFDAQTLTKWTRKRRGGAYEAIDVSMNDYLYEILMRRWKKREQDEWVFYNKRTGTRYNSRPKLMPSLCKRAGIPYYGYRPIRHFVSSYLKNTAKIETKVLQQLLGHKDERTTEIYLHSVVASQKAATDALSTPLFAPKNAKARTAERGCCQNQHKLLILLVGAAGFEPATSCSQSRRAARLRYAPNGGKS